MLDPAAPASPAGTRKTPLLGGPTQALATLTETGLYRANRNGAILTDRANKASFWRVKR